MILAGTAHGDVASIHMDLFSTLAKRWPHTAAGHGKLLAAAFSGSNCNGALQASAGAKDSANRSEYPADKRGIHAPATHVPPPLLPTVVMTNGTSAETYVDFII